MENNRIIHIRHNRWYICYKPMTNIKNNKQTKYIIEYFNTVLSYKEITIKKKTEQIGYNELLFWRRKCIFH